MFETVRRFVRSDRREVLFECRHCGTTLDGPAASCECGDAAGVARYRIR